MYKAQVTYKDLDENPITETHYFNLTETDFAKILAERPELFNPKRLVAIMDRVKSTDPAESNKARGEMIMFIRDIALTAHGSRVENRFVRDTEKTKDFENGLALDAFLQYVLANESSMVTFFKSIIPTGMQSAFEAGLHEGLS